MQRAVVGLLKNDSSWTYVCLVLLTVWNKLLTPLALLVCTNNLTVLVRKSLRYRHFCLSYNFRSLLAVTT